MAEYRVPGVGLGVWHDQRLHVRGFGVTSLDDPRPVTGDTLFTIASISKTMTATAVMKLIDQGRLELQTPVRELLPEFRVRDARRRRRSRPGTCSRTHPAGKGS